MGDLILGVNGTIIRAIAFDFATTQNDTVTVIRGYVTGGVATDPMGRLECARPNAHTTTVGTAVTQAVNGATAADIDSSLVGSYSNGTCTCTATIGAAGQMRVVSGAVDTSVLLGGDEDDTIVVLGGGSAAVVQGTDVTPEGRATEIAFTRSGTGTAATYSVQARVVAPRPIQNLATCSNLVKQ